MDKIEVLDFTGEGYSPVVAYEHWRVAILNYIDELETQMIDNFQKHDLTDEVFVLLEGKCILYVCDYDEKKEIHNIEGIDMERFKQYNVKKGVYHTHTLSKDAKVLIVENDNTNDDNSPKIMINSNINDELTNIKNQLWK